jgi:hypothetical protein
LSFTVIKSRIYMSTFLRKSPTWPASLLFTTTLAAFAWTSSASAESEPDAATVGAARSLAVEGVKLADSGDCQGALAPLTKAEGLYHSQIVASRLGECEITTGRLVEGTERLRKLLREPLPNNPSAALQRALSQAQVLVDQTTPKLASIKIAVVGPDLDKVVVKVNGTPVMAAALGVEFPVNPGTQDVQVEAPGYFPASDSVALSPGQKQTVSLSLQARPPEPVPDEPVATEKVAVPNSRPEGELHQPANPEVSDAESSSNAPAYISYAVGLIGLGVGAGYGYAAKSDHDALAKKCPNNLCPQGEKDNLDAALSKGTIATIGVGVGAAGIVLGTILLLVGGDDAEAASSLTPGDVALKPWIGADQLGLSAKF